MSGTSRVGDSFASIEGVITGLLVDPPLRGQTPEARPLAERMALLEVPGVSIAVVQDGTIAWAQGFGVRDAGETDAVTADTLFQAASISKPITALAVMRLVQDGRLDLDEDVNRYLRSWSIPANGSWRPRVTLRHLLSHTGGTTVHGFPGYRSDRPLPTLRQILDGEPPANTPAVLVNALPGLQVRYSGGGTSVGQQVLTDVTGLPFPDLMRELVLAPLGMTNSTYEQPLPQAWRGKAATGHGVDGTPLAGKWQVYPEMAAAGLWTTPSDLLSVVLEVQRARRTGAGKLFTRHSVEPMLMSQFGGTFGIGFALGGEGDALRLGHGGDNVGFKAEVLAFADHGLGAAVMANGDGRRMAALSGAPRQHRTGVPVAPRRGRSGGNVSTRPRTGSGRDRIGCRLRRSVRAAIRFARPSGARR